MKKYSAKALSLMVLICVSCEPEKHVLQPTTGTVIDYEGNIYQTIKIDDQWWMAENLRTTQYNNGSAIPQVTYFDDWRNLTTPAYVWYNNDPLTYKATYGALYNWYAVNTGNLCPAGWHVPTDDEWSSLTEYLGGESIAGGIMKESGTLHWNNPNVGATNESGFTALPGGFRYGDDGEFFYIGIGGFWWSSTEYDPISAFCIGVYNEYSTLFRGNILKQTGLSLRCLKD